MARWRLRLSNCRPRAAAGRLSRPPASSSSLCCFRPSLALPLRTKTQHKKISGTRKPPRPPPLPHPHPAHSFRRADTKGSDWPSKAKSKKKPRPQSLPLLLCLSARHTETRFALPLSRAILEIALGTDAWYERHHTGAMEREARGEIRREDHRPTDGGSWPFAPSCHFVHSFFAHSRAPSLPPPPRPPQNTKQSSDPPTGVRLA